MRALDPESVEQRGGVRRHVAECVWRVYLVAGERLHDERTRVGAGVVELGREPDVAVVEADDAIAAPGELPAEPLVPPDHLAAQAHDQEHGRGGAITEFVVLECRCR